MSAGDVLSVANDPLLADFDKLQCLIKRQSDRQTQLVIRNLELRHALRALVLCNEPSACLKAMADAKALLANGDM